MKLRKYKQKPNKMWALFYRFENGGFTYWGGAIKSGTYPTITHKCNVVQQDILSNQEFRSVSTVTLLKSLSTIVESFSRHFNDVHQIAVISFETDSTRVQEGTCEAYVFPHGTSKVELLRIMESYATLED